MKSTVHNGIKVIKRSVQLVAEHPILLIYGILSFIISHPLARMLRPSSESVQIFLDTDMSRAEFVNFWSSYSHYQFARVIILSFVSLFFLACLAHHAMHKLKHESHGFINTLLDVAYKLPKLSIWFIFATMLHLCMFYLKLFLKTHPYGILAILAVVVLVLIAYATSLVLPILASEKTGLIEAVKRSFLVVFENWLSFIGIFLLVLLLGCIHILVVHIFVAQFAVLMYTVFYYKYYVQS